MELSVQYMAGLFDGEGHVRFCKTRGNYYPTIFITNTRLDLLEDIRTQFGGNINPLSRKSGWKQAYAWRISWSRAVQFLKDLYPYLRIKDRQAMTVFAWEQIRPGQGHYWIRSDGALDLILKRMNWLNRRGPIVGEDPIESVLRECKYYKYLEQAS